MLSKLRRSSKRVAVAILFAGIMTFGTPAVKANRLYCYNSTEPGTIVCYSTGSSAGPYIFYCNSQGCW